MSLACIIGEEIIRGPFSLIYQIGTNDKGLVYPNDEKQIIPPNVAVCKKHLSRVPKRIFRDSPEKNKGQVWAVANGSGNKLFDGSPSEYDAGHRKIEAYRQVYNAGGNIIKKIKEILEGHVIFTGLDFDSDAISFRNIRTEDKYKYLTCKDMLKFLPEAAAYLCGIAYFEKGNQGGYKMTTLCKECEEKE